MTPTQADTVIAGIRARLTRLAWSPEVWDDFREAMLRVKINDRQGMAAVSNVVMTVKGVPAPAHFIEAFKSAQGEKPQTCSPATPESGYRGEFWHPRGWAIVRGWMWMRREENWDKLPALMEEFSRARFSKTPPPSSTVPLPVLTSLEAVTTTSPTPSATPMPSAAPGTRRLPHAARRKLRWKAWRWRPWCSRRPPSSAWAGPCGPATATSPTAR